MCYCVQGFTLYWENVHLTGGMLSRAARSGGAAHTHIRVPTHAHPTHTLKLVRGAVPSPIPAKHHLQLLFSPALHSQRPDPLPHLPRYPGVHAELWGRARHDARYAVCSAGSGKSWASKGLSGMIV